MIIPLWHIFSAESALYCNLGPMKFWSKYIIFVHENAFENDICKMLGTYPYGDFQSIDKIVIRYYNRPLNTDKIAIFDMKAAFAASHIGTEINSLTFSQKLL